MATNSRQTEQGLVHDRNDCGLLFSVASTVAEVQQAWGLVHDSYVRSQLIAANPAGIHCVPHAVDPGTAVIIGREPCGRIVSTMTSYLDQPRGLPLDAVYPRELDAMRAQQRDLMEVGLFADRREKVTRTIGALKELMRYTFFYAVHGGVSDIVIGVHPHHAGFYRKLFAFAPFAQEAGCPAVNGSPMVPMRLPIRENMRLDPLPKGLAHFKKHPLEHEAFDGRLRMNSILVRGSRIERFLNLRADGVDSSEPSR